jgi:hypothetical protein
MRDIAARSVTAVGLAGIALIHLLDAIGKYSETRYLFWMYVALITGSLAVAGAVLFSRSRLAFIAAAGLALIAAAGYVLSRTTGLPSAMGDVGNWTEPLGLASLFVEGAVAAAAYGLARRPHLSNDAAVGRPEGFMVAPAYRVGRAGGQRTAADQSDHARRFLRGQPAGDVGPRSSPTPRSACALSPDTT